MKLRGIVVEDFINYKLPSLFLITAMCDWKCCVEAGLDIGVCQNSPLAAQPIKEVPNESIYKCFVENDISQAVVVGGLEPFLQFEELLSLIDLFRSKGERCPFIIYTGYKKNEIGTKLQSLSKYDNIIVKFGRFIQNSSSRYDEVLGVTLSSDNQYAEIVS